MKSDDNGLKDDVKSTYFLLIVVIIFFFPVDSTSIFLPVFKVSLSVFRGPPSSEVSDCAQLNCKPHGVTFTRGHSNA